MDLNRKFEVLKEVYNDKTNVEQAGRFGLSPSGLGNFLKRGSAPSFQLLRKMAINEPTLNIYWFMDVPGETNPLRSQDVEKELTRLEQRVEEQQEMIRILRDHVDLLKTNSGSK